MRSDVELDTTDTNYTLKGGVLRFMLRNTKKNERLGKLAQYVGALN